MIKYLIISLLVSASAFGQAFPNNGNGLSGGGGGGVQPSGTCSAGKTAYWDSATTITCDSAYVWDAANNRLGINVSSPSQAIDVAGNIQADGSIIALNGGDIEAHLLQILNTSNSPIASIGTSGLAATKQIAVNLDAADSSTNTAINFIHASGLSGSTYMMKVTNASTVEMSLTNAGVLTANGGFVGALTGNVTGNLTGNVTGNVSGTAGGLSATLAIGSGGTGQTTAANAINALLPSQTSNSGKFLTTNGSVASWGTVSGTLSGLTATRIPYAATATTLTDTASLIFDPTYNNGTLMVGPGTDVSGSSIQISGIPNVESGGSGISKMAYIDNNVTAYNSSPVAGIAWGLRSNAGGAILTVGGIEMGKENSTTDNGDGFFRVITRSGSTFSEGFRVTSGQILCVACTNDDGSGAKLQSTAVSARGGTFYGGRLYATGNNTVTLTSEKGDGAGNQSIVLTSTGAITNATHRLVAISNNNSEKVWWDKDGVYNSTGLTCTGTTHCGQITLSSGSGTATVVSGCKPLCTNTSTEAATKCSVSSTTLTATSGAGTDVINYMCF